MATSACRAYPNVQNLFAELQIQDRLQVPLCLKCPHQSSGHSDIALPFIAFVWSYFAGSLWSYIGSLCVSCVVLQGLPVSLIPDMAQPSPDDLHCLAVEAAQHDICIQGHSRAIQPLRLPSVSPCSIVRLMGLLPA